MRRSTASATSTAKTEPDHKARSGGLILQILAVNVIALLVLVLGILYMGRYRDSLIKAELETLVVQSQLFAGAIAEGAIRPVEQGTPFLFAKPEEIEALTPELARRMVRRFGETTAIRTRLFDKDGNLIGDSHKLIGPGGVVQVAPLEPPKDNLTIAAVLEFIGSKALDIMPVNEELPLYPQTASTDNIEQFPDALDAMDGNFGATAWETADGNIIMTSAAPIQKVKQVMGVVMLTKDGKQIKQAMNEVRFDVFTVFLAALSLTFFLSFYLARMIARPLTKLADAAEAIRQGKGRHINIPDLSHRNDEIGELSLALHDMTQALWDRMDSIEGFAADVAHELKNPLTSLRSAVETASRIKSEKDRQRLMEIILHDVQRLDRLISDISSASRLDAELSRDEMGVVDLGKILGQLVDMYKNPLERSADGRGDEGNSQVILEIPQRRDVSVRGNEGRLAQVFQNLITNALSFSPSGSTVIVRVVPEKHHIRILVEDEGPGIPEKNLATIFERFYTERPRHESYGTHSGLGLSISKQIIDAHGGRIYAENLHDKAGKVTGACFTVVLDKAA